MESDVWEEEAFKKSVKCVPAILVHILLRYIAMDCKIYSLVGHSGCQLRDLAANSDSYSCKSASEAVYLFTCGKYLVVTEPRALVHLLVSRVYLGSTICTLYLLAGVEYFSHGW